MTSFSGDEREEEGLALRQSLSCRSRTPDAAGDVFGLHSAVWPQITDKMDPASHLEENLPLSGAWLVSGIHKD